ncbi:glucose-1-phosphate adenylyltransferase-like isoform X1 [Panulirus ornatus]|uniref:glucose-1-phosphate adenylyltransferase-like isoform X1 n=1 Tax=Panulirus ornatus TaxID=150431 RepID=UPI003A8B084D
MRAVILAAGYGTRLEQDLRSDTSGQYTHLIGIPKPLLPIGQSPLITHWVRDFEQTPEITSVIIVVNDFHKKRYENWAETLQRKVVIVSDGSMNNDERTGAVACMMVGVQQCKEDTIFVAGDTLFQKDFSLNSVILKFQALCKQEKEACLILSAPVLEENVSKHGIIEVAESGRVTRFLEKPLPVVTSSRLQCPCFYIISSESLHYLQIFLEQTKDKPLSSRDATGTFIAELINQVPVYAHHTEGRYDVGSLQSYEQCHHDFMEVDQ